MPFIIHRSLSRYGPIFNLNRFNELLNKDILYPTNFEYIINNIFTLISTFAFS